MQGQQEGRARMQSLFGGTPPTILRLGAVAFPQQYISAIHLLTPSTVPSYQALMLTTCTDMTSKKTRVSCVASVSWFLRLMAIRILFAELEQTTCLSLPGIYGWNIIGNFANFETSFEYDSAVWRCSDCGGVAQRATQITLIESE